MLKKLEPLPSYINGEFHLIQRPDKEFLAINPAVPNQLLAVTRWRKDLISSIVDGLNTSFELYRLKSFEERLGYARSIIDAINERAEEIKLAMMKELARSRWAVEEEWRLCQTLFALLPQFCSEVLRENVSPGGWTWSYAPVGRVFVSSNVALPLYSLLSSILPALIAGNSVCVRPSIHSPLSGLLLAQIFEKTALIPGLIQVVFGDLEVFRQLTQTHVFDTVHYTGGEESLEQIRRDLVKDSQTRLVLCSGGKNAAFMSPECDIEKACRDICYGMTVDTGQRLEATTLVFVPHSRLDEFTDLFVELAKTVPTGVRKDLASSSEHVMGPLCSENAWERFLRFQSIAARESVETLRWGKPIDNPSNGYFVSPGVHLLSREGLEKSVYATNAFFGPDVAVIPVESHYDAIGCLDRLGLARTLSVFSNEKKIVEEVRRESAVPSVLWNCPTTSVDPHLPSFGRGRTGNAFATGLRFLFSTVYPKTLSLRNDALSAGGLVQAVVVVACVLLSMLFPSHADAVYRKAVEGNEVVKGKLYSKSGKVQINFAQFGGILNQSYIDTFLVPFAIAYHINEWHSVSGEFAMGFSSDKVARECVESFFLDPDRAAEASGEALSSPCDPQPPQPQSISSEEGAKPPYQRKPAYVPIRQIEQLYNLNYHWTPVYGKALWFMAAVGYLDVHTTLGLGLASSTFWPLQDTNLRGEETVIEGVPNENSEEWGAAGRPAIVEEFGPTFTVGLGTRFYFAKYFTFNVDFRNTTMMGSDSYGDTEFMNFFSMWGGLGVMF